MPIGATAAMLLAAETPRTQRVSFDGAVSEHKWGLWKELGPDLPSNWEGYEYLVLG